MIQRHSLYKVQLRESFNGEIEIRYVSDIIHSQDDVELIVYDIVSAEKTSIKLKNNKVLYKIIVGNLIINVKKQTHVYHPTRHEREFPTQTQELKDLWQTTSFKSQSRRW
jgi:hypothetical protein